MKKPTFQKEFYFEFTLTDAICNSFPKAVKRGIAGHYEANDIPFDAVEFDKKFSINDPAGNAAGRILIEFWLHDVHVIGKCIKQ